MSVDILELIRRVGGQPCLDQLAKEEFDADQIAAAAGALEPLLRRKLPEAFCDAGKCSWLTEEARRGGPQQFARSPWLLLSDAARIEGERFIAVLLDGADAAAVAARVATQAGLPADTGGVIVLRLAILLFGSICAVKANVQVAAAA